MSINTYPEPYRSAPKDSLIDPSTCYNRECVSYCAWKIKEATGKWPRRTGDMNGYNWIYRLPQIGYKEVAAPTAGGEYVGVAKTGNHVVWWEGGNHVSEYNWVIIGGFHERNVNLNTFRWFQIVAPPVTITTTKKPVKISEKPQKPKTTPNNQPSAVPIKVGDSVTAWGVGYADSNGKGVTTSNFPETRMKVIKVNNSYYALNQYNQGTPGNVPDVTAWWPASQVRKA